MGDLVYLSSENLSLPRGHAQKLAPKYIGPFRNTKEVTPHTTYQLALLADLTSRGIHPTFHANLLRIHIPNDDHHFPARSTVQHTHLGDSPSDHVVKHISSHVDAGHNAWFETTWESVSVCYKERYLKACAQWSLCRKYVTQSFEAQLLCNCDERSMT